MYSYFQLSRQINPAILVMVKNGETADLKKTLAQFGFQPAEAETQPDKITLPGGSFAVTQTEAGFLVAKATADSLPTVLQVKPADDLAKLTDKNLVLPPAVKLEVEKPTQTETKAILAEEMPDKNLFRHRLVEALSPAETQASQLNQQEQRQRNLDQAQADALEFFAVQLEQKFTELKNPELLTLAAELRRRNEVQTVLTQLRQLLDARNQRVVELIAANHDATAPVKANRKLRRKLRQLDVFDALNAYLNQPTHLSGTAHRPTQLKKLARLVRLEQAKPVLAPSAETTQEIDQKILATFFHYHDLLMARKSVGKLSQETLEMAVQVAGETQSDLALALTTQETILPAAMDLIQEHWWAKQPKTKYHPLTQKIQADTLLNLLHQALKKFGVKSPEVSAYWLKLLEVSEIKDKALMSEVALELWRQNETKQPIFYRLMVMLHQVYPESQVIKEHQELKTGVMELINNKSPEWLVSHLPELLKRAEKLVFLPWENLTGLNVGLDLEFKGKQDVPKALPAFPVEYMDKQGLTEVRRKFGRINFNPAYLADLTDLGVWLSRVADELKSIHYHFDIAQHESNLGPTMSRFYTATVKTHRPQPKTSTTTYENRGCTIPLDGQHLDPATLAAELAFFAYADRQPRTEWQALPWPADQVLDWHQAVWGQMLRTTSHPEALLAGLLALKHPQSLNGDVLLPALLRTFTPQALGQLTPQGEAAFVRKYWTFYLNTTKDDDVGRFQAKLKPHLELNKKLPKKFRLHAILADAPISTQKLESFLDQRPELDSEDLTALCLAVAEPEYLIQRAIDQLGENWGAEVNELLDSWLAGLNRHQDIVMKVVTQEVSAEVFPFHLIGLLKIMKSLPRAAQHKIFQLYLKSEPIYQQDLLKVISARSDWSLSFKTGLIRRATPQQLAELFTSDTAWGKNSAQVTMQLLDRLEVTRPGSAQKNLAEIVLNFLRPSIKFKQEQKARLLSFFNNLIFNSRYSTLRITALEAVFQTDLITDFYTQANLVKIINTLNPEALRYFSGYFGDDAHRYPQDFWLDLIKHPEPKVQAAALEIFLKGGNWHGFSLENTDILARENLLIDLLLNGDPKLKKLITKYLSQEISFSVHKQPIRFNLLLDLKSQLPPKLGGKIFDIGSANLAKTLSLKEKHFKLISPDSLLRQTDLTPTQVDELLNALGNFSGHERANQIVSALRNTDLTQTQIDKCLVAGQKNGYFFKLLHEHKLALLSPAQKQKLVETIVSLPPNSFRQENAITVLNRQPGEISEDLLAQMVGLLDLHGSMVVNFLRTISQGPRKIGPPVSTKLATTLLRGNYFHYALPLFKHKLFVGVSPEAIADLAEHQFRGVRQMAKFFTTKT